MASHTLYFACADFKIRLNQLRHGKASHVAEFLGNAWAEPGCQAQPAVNTQYPHPWALFLSLHPFHSHRLPLPFREFTFPFTSLIIFIGKLIFLVCFQYLNSWLWCITCFSTEVIKSVYYWLFILHFGLSFKDLSQLVPYFFTLIITSSAILSCDQLLPHPTHWKLPASIMH